MIDQNGHARLTDFGLLTFVPDPTNPQNSSSTIITGSTRWMSPELLHRRPSGSERSRPTKKSDCYALGMVILEVLSEEPPFPRDQVIVVAQKVIEGRRPERPKGVWFTDGLWGTLERCWLPQPGDRPTVEAILECLGQVSGVLRPLPPIQGNIETDDNEADSTISQCMLLHFVPNFLLTTKKDALKVAPRPSMLKKQVGTIGFNTSTGEPPDLPKERQQIRRGSGISRTEQETKPEALTEVYKPYQEREGDSWDKTSSRRLSRDGEGEKGGSEKKEEMFSRQTLWWEQ